MNWRKFAEDFGEYPDEHFDDPADFQQSAGNRLEAKRIRAQRRKVEDGEVAEDE